MHTFFLEQESHALRLGFGRRFCVSGVRRLLGRLPGIGRVTRKCTISRR